jgi:hypothetical protein
VQSLLKFQYQPESFGASTGLTKVAVDASVPSKPPKRDCNQTHEGDRSENRKFPFRDPAIFQQSTTTRHFKTKRFNSNDSMSFAHFLLEKSRQQKIINPAPSTS